MNKLYPHITGLRTDEGENPTVIAVVAITDPDPGNNYPETARIIVGSPRRSHDHPGWFSRVDGFSGGREAIRKLAITMMNAARDVDAAITPPGAAPTYEDGLVATVAHDLRTSEATTAFTALVSILKAQVATIRDLRFKLDDAEGRLYDDQHHKVKAH